MKTAGEEHPPPGTPDRVDPASTRVSSQAGGGTGSGVPGEEGLGALFSQGRFAEMESAARLMTSRCAADGKGWKALGVALIRQGQIAEALTPLQKAADLLAGDAAARRNLGLALQGLGRLAEAEAQFLRALAIDPEFGGAQLNLASVLRQQGRLLDAEAVCRQALQRMPDAAGVQSLMASILMEQGRLVEAEASLQRALALEPGDAGTLGMLGITLMEQGRLDEAETICRRALVLAPDDANCFHFLASVLQARGRLGEAESWCRRAVAEKAGFAKAQTLLGSILLEQGRLAEAEASLRRALDLNANDARAHNTLGIALMELGRLGEAEVSFRRTVELEPNYARGYSNLGIVLDQQASCASALDAFDRALSLSPDFADARIFRGLVHLKSGNFNHWRDYDERFRLGTGAASRRNVPGQEWDGAVIRGQTLLVWGEQGIGDEIWASGMFGGLRERIVGGRILIECAPKLVKLFERSFGGTEGDVGVDVLAKSEPPDPRCLQGVDYQIPAGSLGSYLRPGLSSFPEREATSGAYLFADIERVAFWRDRLGELGPGLKVGLCWRSSNVRAERALSCTSLRQWGKIFKVPAIQFVNLQYDECEAELAEAEAGFGVKIARYPGVDMFDDLDETAALMRGLDLVISAPTTVGILSAALGVPTWQMHYGMHWQQHGLANSPWYPAMRNYIREWDQPWEEVLSRIAADLAALKPALHESGAAPKRLARMRST